MPIVSTRANPSTLPAAELRHTLRTPINHVLGYTEMLLEDAGSHDLAEVVGELEQVRAAARMLLARVNESLGTRDSVSAEELEALYGLLQQPAGRILALAESIENRTRGGPREWTHDVEKMRAGAEGLLALIGETPARERPAAPEASPPPAPGQARILVVDDNAANRHLLRRRLERQGYTIGEAADGRLALEALRAGTYDLVLLDIVMPEVDGFQVLAWMKEDAALRDVPVIVISALDEISSVVRSIEMGAEDFLFKPFDPVLLRARIGACLEKKRLRDQQREWIRRFATEEVANDLEASGFALGGKYVEATVMFSDIRSFTSIAESQSPEDTIALLNNYYALMFEAISGHGGIVNQMVGDGLMAIFGAPLPLENRRERAVRAALEMIELLQLFNLEQAAQDRVPIRIGIGIASGQVIAGYTGTLRRATYTCVGDTVNVAARLEAHTKIVGEPILIDDATREGLHSGIEIKAQGPVQVQGKTREIQVFSVIVQ